MGLFCTTFAISWTSIITSKWKIEGCVCAWVSWIIHSHPSASQHLLTSPYTPQTSISPMRVLLLSNKLRFNFKSFFPLVRSQPPPPIWS